MRKSNYLFPALAIGLTAVSCQDYDAGVTDDTFKKKEYAENFKSVFGTPDPNQDWSMAVQVTANVNLPEIKGTAKMNICTGDPRQKSTRLLAQVMLQNGIGNISFDAIKGENHVFVTIEQNNAYVVFGQYEIVKGVLNLGSKQITTRAFTDPSSTCPVTKDGEPIAIGFAANGWSFSNPGGDLSDYLDNSGSYNVYTGEIPTVDPYVQRNGVLVPTSFIVDGLSCVFETDSGTGNIYITYGSKVYKLYGWQFAYGKLSNIKIQYLSGVETDAATPWTRGQAYSLYGYDGFFEEYGYYYGPKTHDERVINKPLIYGDDAASQKAMIQKIEKGFEITSTGGVIELPFIYGATSISDQFGYVIYDEGQNPLLQTHYILMSDGRPNTNVYQNAWGNGAETGFSGTSIFDQFIKPLKAMADGKDAPGKKADGSANWCNCGTPSQGVGRWMSEYGTGEHADDCPAKTDPDATCTCPEGSGIFSRTCEHLSSCQDPMKAYVDAYNTKVYGTTYRLAYWDEDEEAFTYDIPAGKKIVFFVCPTNVDEKVTSSYAGSNYNYSIPELNREIGHSYGNTNSPTYDEMKSNGAVKAVAWKAGNATYLGFEDGGGDEDLNDIIFMVSGNFETDDIVTLHQVKWHLNLNPTANGHLTDDSDLYAIESNKPGTAYSQPATNPKNGSKVFKGWATSPTGTPIAGSDDPSQAPSITGTIAADRDICYFAIWEDTPVVPDPEYITWMFACEDLGGTFDYDFNDIVWEVRHDKTNAKVDVRIVAAGGTLPFTLMYNSEAVMTKEQAFGTGCNSSVMIHPTPTEWMTVATSVDADWSVTTHSSDFSVLVLQKAGENGASSTVISVYSKDDENASNNTRTPQVLILPQGWQWPDEGQSIGAKYPSFKTWVQNSSAPFDWSNVGQN